MVYCQISKAIQENGIMSMRAIGETLMQGLYRHLVTMKWGPPPRLPRVASGKLIIYEIRQLTNRSPVLTVNYPQGIPNSDQYLKVTYFLVSITRPDVVQSNDGRRIVSTGMPPVEHLSISSGSRHTLSPTSRCVEALKLI